MRIAYEANDEIRAALARIGRTEDAHFSPSGRRLALAGLNENYVLVLDLRIDRDAATPTVMLSGCLEVMATGFRSPHGLFWLDDRVLIVCCRHGEIDPCGGAKVPLRPAPLW